MSNIYRHLDEAQQASFDLIVVGGGIYGTCLTLEAARRGLKTLLIERDDFGGATSFNSLRILHGGLRYLQHLDIGRVVSSIREQGWWLRNFDDLVDPLPCLMPLYNRGIRRRSLVGPALALNSSVSRVVRTREFGPAAGSLVRRGTLIDRNATTTAFPLVDPRGLTGGAVWHDAIMTSPHRLLIEALRWATSCGATALNYVECIDVVEHQGRVAGVRARCTDTQHEFVFRAGRVINCAGPWAAEISPIPAVGKQRGQMGLTIAYNLVLSRAPLSEFALAVTRPCRSAHTYFMVPQGDQTMVGTSYLPASGGTPTQQHIDRLLYDLNEAIPGYELKRDDVIRVMVGRLPVSDANGRLPARSPAIIHHKDRGGPAGMVSVVGVKYTTARGVAERTLRQIYRREGVPFPTYSDVARPRSNPVPTIKDLAADSTAASDLGQWMARESIRHLDDLLLRRCQDSWTQNQAIVAEQILDKLGWDEVRSAAELERLNEVRRSQKSPVVAV